MGVWLTTPRRETKVEIASEEQIAELGRMTVTKLRQQYAEVFGEETRSNNKQFLYRRIAWRIQALAEGGLSERARRRALEIANDADLRIRAPRKKPQDPDAFLKVSEKVPKPLDSRLPAPGAWLERVYRGNMIAMKVRIDGIEFEGRVYKTLTAAVNEATGGRWNGYKFFGLPSPAEADSAEE
jgi:hypothetical protein